jgi:hypothetical protein
MPVWLFPSQCNPRGKFILTARVDNGVADDVLRIEEIPICDSSSRATPLMRWGMVPYLSNFSFISNISGGL